MVWHKVRRSVKVFGNPFEKTAKKKTQEKTNKSKENPKVKQSNKEKLDVESDSLRLEDASSMIQDANFSKIVMFFI